MIRLRRIYVEQTATSFLTPEAAFLERIAREIGEYGDFNVSVYEPIVIERPLQIFERRKRLLAQADIFAPILDKCDDAMFKDLVQFAAEQLHPTVFGLPQTQEASLRPRIHTMVPSSSTWVTEIAVFKDYDPIAAATAIIEAAKKLALRLPSLPPVRRDKSGHDLPDRWALA